MSLLIEQVGTLYQGAHGRRAEWIVDGSLVDAIQASLDRRNLEPPKGAVESFLILTDGTRVTLPFCGIAYRTPDHTGVVAIFEPGQYLNAQGEDMFPRPHNAAIFNADGSLRCQVHFEGGAERNRSLIIERHFTRHITRKPGKYSYSPPGDLLETPIVQFGFLVGTKDAPPESFYILNCETGELTDGCFLVPY
ncbi:UNVERIFIED_ORG: hypothetical protein LHJ69_13025 [Shinella sp. XGS7]|nr:hypothetical protein [Shinella sp. XGS7]